MLSEAQLNSLGVHLPDVTRAQMWVKVAQAYLKGENTMPLEAALKHADALLKKLSPEEPEGAVLRVQYDVVQAQSMDLTSSMAKNNFLKAAMRYAAAAGAAADAGFPQEEVTALFEQAARCVVLAVPDPSRSRVMSNIAGDPRVADIGVRCVRARARAPFSRTHAPPPTPSPRLPAAPLPGHVGQDAPRAPHLRARGPAL